MAQVILTPIDAPSWWDFITKFDATYQSFQDNYNALMYLGPYIQTQHPELLVQYEDMLQQGAVNADKLNQLKATRDYVYSWLTWLQQGGADVSSFIASGAQSTYDWITKQLGLSEARQTGLGIAPLIVLVSAAAGIAALVAVAAWITDAYVFAQRLNALQDLESKGYSPEQAAQTVNAALGPPPSQAGGGFLGIPFGLLVWGAVAIFLGPPLLRLVTGDRR